MSVEEGYIAVRQTILNLFSVVKTELGNLDQVERVVKVNGYMNSAPDFDRLPSVISGASDLLANMPARQLG